MKVNNRYAKLGKNIGLLTVGNLASKLLSFLLIPFYTSVLSTEDFGTADLITTTISLLSPVFTLLISEATLRFALDKYENPKDVFSISIYTTLIGFVVMLPFSLVILMSETIKSYYGLFLLYYFVNTLYLVLSQFVRGIEKITTYTVAGVINTFAFIVSNLVLLLIFDMGLQGYLYSYIVSNLFSILVLLVGGKLWNYMLSFRAVSISTLKDMYRYCIPMIPNTISWWVSNSSNKYVMMMFVDVAAIGVYSVAYRIPSFLTAFTTIFISAWQISAVEDFGSKESVQFYSNIYTKYFSINVLIAGFLIVFSKPMGYMLFSGDFFTAWKYVPMLLIASVLSTLAAFLGSIYTSAKRTKVILYTSVFGALTNIIFNFILIPIFGAMGAALATLLGYLIMWLMRVFDSRKIMALEVKNSKIYFSLCLLLAEGILVCLDKIVFVPLAVAIYVVIIFMNFQVVKSFFTLAVSLIHKQKHNVPETLNK